MSDSATPLAKALAINKDPRIYGTFAEIGAGQEVARLFFQAGQASQTVAKTISAYDMIYSDEIYGKEASGRYVCESRLKKMLDKEFSLLTRRLTSSRGERTTFFAFANTVSTGDKIKKFSHGWMGVRFQTVPGGPHNDIIMHVRMLFRHRLQQQEILGILGVNLVSVAFHELKNPQTLVSSLVDGIKDGQVSIDMIKFEGPDINHINNHLLNLELVRRGLADAVMFGPDQSILSVGDEVFGKSLVLQRGTFRPVTNTHLALLNKATYQLQQDFPQDSQNSLVLFELTMQNLQQDGHVNEADFLDRVRSLCTLGGHVLVSNFVLYYKLKRYLRQYTDKPMVLIVGASHLPLLFDSIYYNDLEGGLLEGMGKLLDEKTRLYIYPHRVGNTVINAKKFSPPKNVALIYEHFLQSGSITDIAESDQIEEIIHSDQVREWIAEKNPRWENHVPNHIRDMIKSQGLFGLIG